MDEAKQMVHEALRRATQSMNAAQIMTLARCYAKRDVKARLRAQGFRPQYMEASEVSRAANAYLNSHPELIEQAADFVRNDPKLRTLAQRQGRNH